MCKRETDRSVSICYVFLCLYVNIFVVVTNKRAMLLPFLQDSLSSPAVINPANYLISITSSRNGFTVVPTTCTHFPFYSVQCGQVECSQFIRTGEGLETGRRGEGEVRGVQFYSLVCMLAHKYPLTGLK